MEQLLEDVEPPKDKVFDDLTKELKEGEICPVLLGSAENGNGILRLLKAGHIRATVDQQPYVQGFYPVVQLTLNLRYGIVPTDMDAGAIILRQSDVDRVLELTRQKYR